MGPKASSVTVDGQDDGFVVVPGWCSEVTPDGETRIVVSVPASDLARVHAALASVLTPPISVLYRQKVDRLNPKPQGSPPRDFVGLELDLDRVLQALAEAAPLVYHDARGELWLRGSGNSLDEQLILDQDGLVFCYPDDPAYRDALDTVGVPGEDVQTIADRDYVKHWFHAAADAAEASLIRSLRLAEVPAR